MTISQSEISLTHHTRYINGVRIHYVMAGSGEPLVLLHGWPQTWYAWKEVIPALAEHYTVIAPDLRGSGYSDKPATGYDKKTLADDVRQLVQQLGFEKISLVGHDIGGMVAFSYAAEYPEEVRKLVLMELLVPGFGLEKLMDVAQGGMWHFGFHMVQDLPEALITGRERIYLSHFFRSLSYNPETIHEEAITEYVHQYAEPGALRAGFEQYRTLFEDSEHNQQLIQNKLEMPILAFGGDRSVGDFLRQSLLPIAEQVSGGAIENCGHYIAEEQPEFFVKELLAFLNN